MFPRLVAFIGPIGCGKTTAAKILEQSERYKRIAFADSLKSMLFSMGLTAEEVYGKDKETPSALLGGKTPRYAMQTLGTEWGRDLIAKDLWINVWARRVDTMIGTRVVVDDCRFPNEAALVRDRGGKIIKIFRGTPATKMAHESESYDITPDYSITNMGSISHFTKTIYIALNYLTNS